MPHASTDDTECVLFNDIPAVNPAYAMTEAEDEKWNRIIALRDDVNKALELARSEQGIKKSTDAALSLTFTAAAFEQFQAMNLSEADLATLCISLAEGAKCPRCWNHDTSIGTSEGHAELCARCAAVLGE